MGVRVDFDSQIGYFKSVESLKAAWQRHLESKSHSIKDDRGLLILGVWQEGYKILTRPPKVG